MQPPCSTRLQLTLHPALEAFPALGANWLIASYATHFCSTRLQPTPHPALEAFPASGATLVDSVVHHTIVYFSGTGVKPTLEAFPTLAFSRCPVRLHCFPHMQLAKLAKPSCGCAGTLPPFSPCEAWPGLLAFVSCGTNVHGLVRYSSNNSDIPLHRHFRKKVCAHVP